MKSTTTYLHFNGNCRSAITFYRECFGGELEVVPVPDASGKPSQDSQARVQHSTITRDGRAVLMASDYPPGVNASNLGNNFSVFIDCSTNGELDGLFAALSQDGTVTVPPSDMPSGRFGMCDDAFGVSWILNCAGGR